VVRGDGAPRVAQNVVVWFRWVTASRGPSTVPLPHDVDFVCGACFPGAIAEGLNEEGVPTAQSGKQWYAATVRRVLLRTSSVSV
jgi:hypothetical protein